MKNDINLFSTINSSNKSKMDKSTLIFISIIGGIFLLTLIAILTVFFMNMANVNEIKRIDDILSSPQALQSFQKDKEIKTKIIETEKNILTLDALEKNINIGNGFNLVTYDLIRSVKPSQVDITSFSFNENTFTINCESQKYTENPPADFVKAIESTNSFSKVTYTGFTQIEDEGKLSFSVICVVKEKTDE